MYISLEVCKDICIIDKNFPHNNTNDRAPQINNINKPDQPAAEKPPIPTKPAKLPFEPTDENLDKLENYFLETFKDTTFKTTGPLPAMSGGPATIHLQKDATPHQVNVPIPLPHHMKKGINEELQADVEKGILRKADGNKPTKYCSQMLPVMKKNGTFRRTVDYRQLNANCKRVPHHTPRPFNIISSIPSHSYKTVLDAYNGYHQISLDEKSIELTTFITEIIRFQSLRAPQGFSGSGDMYTRRYDEIIVNVPRKGKIVDDTILYDSNIEEAFHHTFDYLRLCAENGITLNPEKFRFSRKEVEFCGFLIGWDGYRLCDDMIAAIKNFPMPESPTITDIRAWFGVVNQLAPFIAKADIMAPFRDLLKSKNLKGKKVFWDSMLKNSFEQSKIQLCDIATKGLTNYELNRDTALVTDWSKKGIGFVLLQKHCACVDNSNPTCCDGGWKLVYCNSRTLGPEEQGYVPVEGEGLAVTWALKKCRMFLLGHPKFFILVDQRPLVKIFGSKPLADIENSRLQNQKEKTLQYNFEIKHIEGVKNHANTFSRYPVHPPDSDDITHAKSINALEHTQIIGTIETTLSITLDKLKKCANSDPQLQSLTSKVKTQSFAESMSLEDPSLKEFYNVRDRLSITNGILMYSFEDGQKRIVIPKTLRKQMILNLHSANQGSTSMLARARKSWYWPGMDRDILVHSETCDTCCEMAPSKTKEPLNMTPPPEYPFQQAVADLFEIHGIDYLAYVDRLTGFAELAHFPTSTSSYHIINTLREFYHRWGVVEEISLDGASNLQSSEIKQWLEKWGTTIRKSSAYYPQSNGRAEAGVKSLKRLLTENTGPKGSIHTDGVARALLQYRNTPLRDINKSPAELALGRELRDTLPLPTERYKINPHWAFTLRERERTMSERNAKTKAKHDLNSHTHPELVVGDEVLCQNVKTKKWDRSGVVFEVCAHRQYTIKMDGSSRLSTRNRRHLQKTTPIQPVPTTTNPIPPLESLSAQQVTTSETPQQAPQETVHQSIVQPPTQETLRRSTRETRKPTRFGEEFGY